MRGDGDVVFGGRSDGRGDPPATVVSHDYQMLDTEDMNPVRHHAARLLVPRERWDVYIYKNDGPLSVLVSRFVLVGNIPLHKEGARLSIENIRLGNPRIRTRHHHDGRLLTILDELGQKGSVSCRRLEAFIALKNFLDGRKFRGGEG